MDFAFVKNVWEKDAFELIADKTFRLEDIRSGLHMMREAAITAEDASSRKVNLEHAKKSVEKLDTFNIKKSSDLTPDEVMVLKIARENPNTKIGDLFRIYQNKGNTSVYKTFQRRIKKLEANKFIAVEKIEGGKEGTTTIIKCKELEKKLSEF